MNRGPVHPPWFPRPEPLPPDPTFRRDWTDLRRRIPGWSVFDNLSWIEVGIRHALPPGHRPVAFRFLDETGHTAALALLQEAPIPSRLGTLRTLRTIEVNSQRVIPLVARNEEAQARALIGIWKALGDSFDLFDFFKLDPQQGAIFRLRDALETAGVPCLLAAHDLQPRLVLPESPEALLSMRNRVSRKKLRWGRNRIQELAGPPSLVRLRDPEDHRRFGFERLREVIEDLVDRSWQGRLADPLHRSVNRVFYREVMETFGPRGMLDVCLLEAGGRFLAFDLNLVEDGIVSMMIGGYDPEWHRFSPGSQLFVAWAADSVTRGDRVLEFGSEHLEYKSHWATDHVQSFHLRIFGRTIRGRLKWSREDWAGPPRGIRAVTSRLMRVASRLPSKWLDADGMLVFELPLSPLVEIPGTTVRALGPDDIPAMTACRSMTHPEAGRVVFERRFEAGAQSWGIEEAGRLLGYLWASKGRYLPEDRDRYQMALGPRDVYLFDTFVRPEVRGRRFAEALLATAQRALLQKGADRFFSTVAWDNRSSLRIHGRMGARRLETVGHFLLPGIRLHVSDSPAGIRIQAGDRDFVSQAFGRPEPDGEQEPSTRN